MRECCIILSVKGKENPKTRKASNMKYTVTFSCGHEAKVELFGKTSERDRRIAWYEKEGVCPDCYRKMKEEERKQPTKSLQLTPRKSRPSTNCPNSKAQKNKSHGRERSARVLSAPGKRNTISFMTSLSRFGAARLKKSPTHTGTRLSTAQPPKRRKPLCWR